MPRPVSPTLPDAGLLVGWSLEGEPRKPLIGFTAQYEEGAGSKFLESIVHSGEGHLITIAPTGAGKGVGCVVPALLRYPGPVVVIDPKGENYAVTARARREMGQKVTVLDPFGISTGKTEENGTFNPLDFLSPENPTLVEDAEMIATTLVSSTGGQHRDPFWPYMGGQLLTLLLLYQVKRLPEEDWTLAKTRELLARSQDAWQEFGKELLNDPDPAIRQLAGIVANPAQETFGGYWAFSQMQTACFKGEMISNCISSSSFSLQDLVDGKPLSIYIIIPPEKLDAYGNLLKVWLSVMIAALTHRRSRPKHSTLFILDEAAQLGPMPQLRRAITLLRGYGVRVWSFWQDLSQIQGLYPNEWQTLLNNCRVQQFYSQSTRLGSQQTYDVTGLGTPEYLQSLEPGEMVLSVLGDQPVIARVPNYLADTPFKGLFDDNPFYHDSDKSAPTSSRVFRRSRINYDTQHQFSKSSRLGRDLLKAQKFHPVPKQRWENIDGEEAALLLRELREGYQGLDGAVDKHIEFRRWPLTFYPDYDYYEIVVAQPNSRELGYFLRQPGEAIFLDGSTNAIHGLNERLSLKLHKSDSRDYLYFFCTSMECEHGRFLIIDELDDLTFRIEPDDDYLKAVSEAIQPPSYPVSRELPGIPITYEIVATCLYADELIRATFMVTDDGNVTMLNDEHLFGQMPVLKDTQLRGFRLTLEPR